MVIESGVDPRFFLSEDPDESVIALEIVNAVVERSKQENEQAERERLRARLKGGGYE